MKPGQHTRKTLSNDERDYTLWPEVDVSAMDEQAADRFLQVRKALTEYLDGGKLARVCTAYHVTKGELLRRLNRCVRIAWDGRPWGWRALIPNHHIVPYCRQKQAQPTDDLGRGLAGAFHQLLVEHPLIEKALVDKILKKGRRGEVHELRIDAVNLYKFFLKLCTDEGIPATQYPFNTDSRGLRAVRRFVDEVEKRDFGTALAARYGQEAAHRARVGTGHPAKLLAATIFDVAQIDEHRLHFVGVIGVPTPHGIQVVPIRRLVLILIVEVISTAILGYAIAVRREANAMDLLEAVNSAFEIWKPCELTIPGLAYPPGAGLPSGIIPELSGCAWTILQMDNALIHYSDAVIGRLRRQIGCAICFGPVRFWAPRAVIERIFKALEQRGFQRLPSSTGSNAGNPLTGNANRVAVQCRAELGELREIIDIEVAKYDNEPTEGLSFKSPLQVLRDFAVDADGRFLPRRLPPCSTHQPPLMINIVRCRVRGSQKQGRRPFIELDRARYTNDKLANAPGLIGKELILHVDERDMRTVRAFFVDGGELGVLRAMGTWSRTPHTREMRKLINSLKDRGELMVGRGEDSVELYTTHLTNKAARDATHLSPHAPHTSDAATKLARVTQVTGQPLPASAKDNSETTGPREASSALRGAPRNVTILHRAFVRR